MTLETLNLKVVIILTVGFSLASLFGYLTNRIKLSPILGYLLAGYLIGPFSPGFVADLQLAEQLAEVGVMLMMFGVGMHFDWRDLASVKNIAIPGAIGQILVATGVTALFVNQLWGTWQSGVLIGLAIGVASTVVLVRVLSDEKLLNTVQGHIAMGWLIVEDIITVVVLILLPVIVALLSGSSVSLQEIFTAMAIVLVKFILLGTIVFTIGRKFVSYVLVKVARTKLPELFTLTVFAVIFVIATGSAIAFGASIALGAFLAGMVIGQTSVRQQAAAYALPMKDLFVVIFFLSVGMLFNPSAIVENFSLFISILAVILLIKPLAAFLIVKAMRYPMQVALSVAIALAQIGEFSFILAEEAGKFGIFSDAAYDIIVACAIISISINPLLFKILNFFSIRFFLKKTTAIPTELQEVSKEVPHVLVVGFSILGKKCVDALERLGYLPIVIEQNPDAAINLIAEGRKAVYGDAAFPSMLESAHIESASLLAITIFNFEATLNIIRYAKSLCPTLKIIACAKNLQEQQALDELGAIAICEEEELGNAFERSLLLHLEPVQKR